MISNPLAAFDAILAASAPAQGCRRVTRDVRDFAQAGLDLPNPWESA